VDLEAVEAVVVHPMADFDSDWGIGNCPNRTSLFDNAFVSVDLDWPL